MTTIGLSRKQIVCAVAETVKGTMVFPSSKEHGVLPAGNAVMNQSPDFTDSEELSDTLDVIDQFQNSMPAGSFEIPTYVRPSGTLGSLPQGDALFQSLQGGRNAATTMSLSANIAADTTSLDFDTMAGGTLPQRGKITIGTEIIYYTGMSMSTTTSGTLSGLTRGSDSSTAATHATNDGVTLNTVFYKQDAVAPSFSLWIKNDHFLQGMSGCAVNSATLGVNKQGAVSFKFSGQGMQMVFAGKDTLATNAASGQANIEVNNPKRFKAGAYVWNETQDDSNSTAGYEISSVNITTSIVVVGSNLASAWATDDVVRGYLPTFDTIGSAIESRYTDIYLDSVAAKFKTTEFSFNTPKQFVEDEVGVDYPEDYIENIREITSSMDIYFREEDAAYFTDGINVNDVVIHMDFGRTAGSIMRVHMKKSRLSVPDINFAAPATNLKMGIKALGTDDTVMSTKGENSAEITFD